MNCVSVPDPELPVLTLGDLGVIRDLRQAGDGSVEVDLTPTYTGCPAMAVIADDVRDALHRAGADQVRIRTVLAPAWTTDWLSAAAKEKLEAYGIAAPGRAAEETLVSLTRVRPSGKATRCPYCGSRETIVKSEFGSTACKAICFCNACRQPFELFKAI